MVTPAQHYLLEREASTDKAMALAALPYTTALLIIGAAIDATLGRGIIDYLLWCSQRRAHKTLQIWTHLWKCRPCQSQSFAALTPPAPPIELLERSPRTCTTPNPVHISQNDTREV